MRGREREREKESLGGERRGAKEEIKKRKGEGEGKRFFKGARGERGASGERGERGRKTQQGMTRSSKTESGGKVCFGDWVGIMGEGWA